MQRKPEATEGLYASHGHWARTSADASTSRSEPVASSPLSSPPIALSSNDGASAAGATLLEVPSLASALAAASCLARTRQRKKNGSKSMDSCSASSASESTLVQLVNARRPSVGLSRRFWREANDFQSASASCDSSFAATNHAAAHKQTSTHIVQPSRPTK